MVKIFLPKSIKIIYFNNSWIYLFNKNVFIHFKTNNFNLQINKFLNVITLQKKLPKSNNNASKLNVFMFAWDNYFFSKINFLGKGFKIKKNNNIINFNFNHSHINYFMFKTMVIKKIQKTKLFLLSKNQNLLKKINLTITDVKLINIYTKRGLRLSNQIVLKKKAKSTTS